MILCAEDRGNERKEQAEKRSVERVSKGGFHSVVLRGLVNVHFFTGSKQKKATRGGGLSAHIYIH